MTNIIARLHGALSEGDGLSVHPMIDVDGVQKHRNNSEGRPIHPTDEGIRNFHRWFGDSKVVDEHGRPKVVYHGTRSPDHFTKFSTGSQFHPDDDDMRDIRVGGSNDPTAHVGAHFADEHEVASKFAHGNAAEWDKQRAVAKDGHGGRVIPVYLKIEKPTKMSDEGFQNATYEHGKSHELEHHLDSAAEEMADNQEDDEDRDHALNYEFSAEEKKAIHLEKTSDELYDSGVSEREGIAMDLGHSYKEHLISKGHDGVRYKNAVEGGHAWVALHPHQIKSAIGNSGAFSAKSDHMHESTEDLEPADGTYYRVVTHNGPKPPDYEKDGMPLHQPGSKYDVPGRKGVHVAHSQRDAERWLPVLKRDGYTTGTHASIFRIYPQEGHHVHPDNDVAYRDDFTPESSVIFGKEGETHIHGDNVEHIKTLKLSSVKAAPSDMGESVDQEREDFIKLTHARLQAMKKPLPDYAKLSDDELRDEGAKVRAAHRDWQYEQNLPKGKMAKTLSAMHARSPKKFEDLHEFHEYLKDEHQMHVAKDGLVEPDRLTHEAKKLIGDLPIAMYHHTSSALLPKIKKEGLIVGEQTNHFNSQAGVYVTTMAGPSDPTKLYGQVAARKYGGHPVAIRVRRKLSEIKPDPDDADLEWAQGRQHITTPVPPHDIMRDVNESTLLTSKSGFEDTDDKGELSASDLSKLDNAGGPEEKAEPGKAWVVHWADGRAVCAHRSRSKMLAWARKVGAWAEIVSIKYGDPVFGKENTPVRVTEGAALPEYPHASTEFSKLTVHTDVPNTASIAATFDKYKVLRGIRHVPMSEFGSPTKHDLFYDKADHARVDRLTDAIRQSSTIKPLIVAVDREGPYVLEGAHRLAALHAIGETHVPALVVHDLDDGLSVHESEVYKLPSGEVGLVSSDGMKLHQALEVDGVVRHTKNSEGRRIHNTDEGVKNYWRWATADGHRPLVDDEGRPKVVYHASDAKFDTFRHRELGSHFGNKDGEASTLGKPKAYYLRYHADVRMPDHGTWEPEAVLKSLAHLPAHEVSAAHEAVQAARAAHPQPADDRDGSHHRAIHAPVRELMDRHKLDLVQYRNDCESCVGGRDNHSFIALHAGQIKSAYGTKGTFSTATDKHTESVLSRITAALMDEDFQEVFSGPEKAAAFAKQRSSEDGACWAVVDIGDGTFMAMPYDEAAERVDDTGEIVAAFSNGAPCPHPVDERHSERSKLRQGFLTQGNKGKGKLGYGLGNMARSKNARQSARARLRRGALYAAKKRARLLLHHPDSHK